MKMTMTEQPRLTAALLTVATVTSLLAAPVAAQSAQRGVSSANPLEILVVTASRDEQPRADFLGSVDVVGSAELDLISHQHIQQALVRVPGVNLQRGDGQEYLPAVRSPVLTGAGACGGFLIAEDSIPVRAAGFCNINELFETHSEQASRIEVLRGPGTALHGSNAMHGIINVITPAPAERRRRIGVEFGPWDTARIELFASEVWGAHGGAIAFTGAHDGSFRDDAGVDQQKLTLRHRFTGDNVVIDSGLTATNLNQETAGYIEGEGAYKHERLREQNLNPEAYRDARAARLWSQWRYSFDARRELKVTPYLRDTRMTFRQHFLPGKPLEENGQKSIGVLSSYHVGLNDQLELIAGLDGEFSQGYLKQSQESPTVGSAFLQATIPQGKHYDYEVDALMVAPFAQLDWTVTDRWRITAGLRYEHMRYDYDNQMIAGRSRDDGTPCAMGGCRYNRPADREDSFNNWSPKLAIGYQLAEHHLLYLNLAHGFRAPQATELYRLQEQQTVADLDSEVLKSIELGAKGGTSQYGYTLALFAMQKDNVIFQDSARANVDNGETDHFGLEASLRLQFAPAWGIEFSGSYARHRYANDPEPTLLIDGNDLDGAPRFFASTRLGWSPTDKARVELEWIHMDDYYLDPENTVEYGGHDLFNLRLTWSPARHWTLFARIHNLTDTGYAERADFTTFSGPRYFPGMERALFAGITWEM